MMKKNTDEALRCSFCDASQNEVKKLIAGKSVFICDKCVGVCQEIIDEDQNYDVSPRSVHLPKPLAKREARLPLLKVRYRKPETVTHLS